MNIEDTFYLGSISKTVGYKGELAAILDVDDPEKYNELESVFLLIEKKLVPFFIEKLSFRPNSNHVIIKFRDINSEEKAERLVDSELHLPAEMLPPLSGNHFYFHEVEGFQVFDTRYGYLGKLEKILDYPGNPLMQILKKNREILIPVKDEFINEVDRESEKIVVSTPDGLIDIYNDN